MSVRPRSVAGIAVAAVIGAGALFALPAAGFASDAADAADRTELVRHRHERLTDEQRECLAEQGITRPDGRPTPAERRALRQQLREAADECGIERPLRHGHRCGRHGAADTDDPSTTDDSSNTADPAVIPAA